MLLTAAGSEPLRGWSVQGHIKQIYSKSARSNILIVDGRDTIISRNIQLTSENAFVIIEAQRLPGKHFALQLQVTDTTSSRRRFYLSTAYRVPKVDGLRARLPLLDTHNEPDGKWVTMALDVGSILDFCFKRHFATLDSVQLQSSCRLQRLEVTTERTSDADCILVDSSFLTRMQTNSASMDLTSSLRSNGSVSAVRSPPTSGNASPSKSIRQAKFAKRKTEGLDDSFDLPGPDSASDASEPPSPRVSLSTRATPKSSSRSRIPIRSGSNNSLRSPLTSDGDGTTKTPKKVKQPVFTFKPSPRSPPRPRHGTVSSSFDETGADFKSPQSNSRPSSRRQDKGADATVSRPISSRGSVCSVDDRIAQLRAELASRPRSSNRSRASSATKRPPDDVPSQRDKLQPAQAPEDVLASLFATPSQPAKTPVLGQNDAPKALCLDGFQMADDDFLLNDNWRNSESPPDTPVESDFESQYNSLRHDVLTELRSHSSLSHRPSSSVLDREQSSLNPHVLLAGRLDEDCDSSNSSSTVRATGSRLSQISLDEEAAFSRRIDNIGTPNPGHLHAHALWEDDWDVRYSPEPDSSDDEEAERQEHEIGDQLQSSYGSSSSSRAAGDPPAALQGARDDELREVIYDPSLNCYFDPEAHQYYTLA
eukprot:TRINITY_DN8558_c0_g1_i2.p1 TRINITY_DN8558_c0_g1~~TRINITY_DN8558_c0_g1_i2.p1  ORF type:complete len:650 (+),score=84.25 TRINITY_DN8558_c0_g1_i2:51-2000(+)